MTTFAKHSSNNNNNRCNKQHLQTPSWLIIYSKQNRCKIYRYFWRRNKFNEWKKNKSVFCSNVKGCLSFFPVWFGMYVASNQRTVNHNCLRVCGLKWQRFGLTTNVKHNQISNFWLQSHVTTGQSQHVTSILFITEAHQLKKHWI